jgi:uncharacterized membrane protein YgcG
MSSTTESAVENTPLDTTVALFIEPVAQISKVEFLILFVKQVIIHLPAAIELSCKDSDQTLWYHGFIKGLAKLSLHASVEQSLEVIDNETVEKQKLNVKGFIAPGRDFEYLNARFGYRFTNTFSAGADISRETQLLSVKKTLENWLSKAGDHGLGTTFIEVDLEEFKTTRKSMVKSYYKGGSNHDNKRGFQGKSNQAGGSGSRGGRGGGSGSRGGHGGSVGRDVLPAAVFSAPPTPPSSNSRGGRGGRGGRS